MARQPVRNPALVIALLVVGVVAAVAIAVAFDSPTSVFLLTALALAAALFAIYSSRRGNR